MGGSTYTITITEHKTELQPRRKWLQRTGDGSYEYVDDEWWDTTNDEIFSQRVETLNLIDIVRAVNGMVDPVVEG